MESITISGIKDTEEFKKNKLMAWDYINGNGSFNIDDFEPAQYKYFDKLLQLYGRLKDEKITKEQAMSEDKKNYAELENYVDERLAYIQDRLLIAQNIKSANEDLTKIEKSDDITVMFNYMSEAIGKMIDDESFASRQKKKIKSMKCEVEDLKND